MSIRAFGLPWGGENAHEIIHQSVERCREVGGRISTPVFTAKVDLQRWADYPQDDATGLTVQHQSWYSVTSSFPMWLSEYFWGGPASGDEQDTNRPEVFNRALALGGSKTVSFTIDSDESGLVSRVSVGDAVTRGYAAAAILSLEELVSKNSVNDVKPVTSNVSE